MRRRPATDRSREDELNLRTVGALALIAVVALALAASIGRRDVGRPRLPPNSFSPSPEEKPSPPPDTDAAKRFGVMLSTSLQNRFFVPQQLGVSWARANLYLGRFTGTCPVCEIYDRAGLKLILTVFNSPGARIPSIPADDLDAYGQQLADVIDAVDPEVIAIENEQENPRFFAGTPEQYGEMLSAACRVAHERSVECTDGGLAAGSVRSVVFKHLVETGQAARASAYARDTTFSEDEYRTVTDPANDELAERVANSSAFVSTYSGAGADYVNFHWYYPDTDALADTISYLEERTGLPAVTNEIGQVDPAPSTVTALLEQISESDLRFAIWFSIDLEGRYHRAVALQNPDGSLRPNGLAFRAFLRQTGAG